MSGPRASVASALKGCVWALQCSQTVSMGIGDAFADLCGWVVPFLSKGLWVPKAWSPLLYVCVYLRIHVAECVVLRVLEHCAVWDSVCLRVTGRLCCASLWNDAVKLWLRYVSLGAVMSLGECMGWPV